MADPCVCHCSSMSHSYVAVICRCWSKFIRVQAVRAASVKRPCYLLRSESVTSRVWVIHVTHISGSYHTYYLNVLHCLYLYYCNAASLSFQPQLAYRNSHAFLLYHLKLASLSDLRSGSVSGNQLLIGRTSSDRSNMIGRTRPSCLLHSRAHDDLVRPITTCSTYRYIRGRMPATFESGHYTTLESGHYTTSRADITLHLRADITLHSRAQARYRAAKIVIDFEMIPVIGSFLDGWLLGDWRGPCPASQNIKTLMVGGEDNNPSVLISFWLVDNITSSSRNQRKANGFVYQPRHQCHSRSEVVFLCITL